MNSTSCLNNHPEKGNNVLLDLITDTQNIETEEDFIEATPVKCGKSNGRKRLALNEMSSETTEQIVASSPCTSDRKTKGIFDEKCDLEGLFCVQERYVQV